MQDEQGKTDKREKHGIIWFRNNLRATDNTALKAAIDTCERVTGIFIFDPRHYAATPWGFPKTGGHRVRFLLETLEDLQQGLGSLGIPLHIELGKPEEIFPRLEASWNIDAIYTQKEWTSEEVRVNRRIQKNTHLQLMEYYDQFLIAPDTLPFGPAETPEIFTRFRKAVEPAMKVAAPIHHVRSLASAEALPGLHTALPHCRDLGITEAPADPRTAFPYKGGTIHALERIDRYFWKTKKLQYYKRTRNGLTGDYSSKLSPWLANGSLSARMIYWEVKKFEEQIVRNQDTYWLIFELLWRDYFKYISLKHGDRLFYPGGIRQESERQPFSRVVFERWVNGRTGDDFVDANMLELSKTGWMSNRGRQNVASYWAKDLHQDWRAGAAWFESTLIDYDVHSNWGNWNYVSGVGNDPRDRKFNTRSQAERYDPKGAYRNLWLQNTLF